MSSFQHLDSPSPVMDESLLTECYEYAADLLETDYVHAAHTADVEEIVQTAVTNAWKGYASFEGRSPFKKWFHSVVHNALLDQIDRQQREPELLSLDDLPMAYDDQFVDTSTTYLYTDIDDSLVLAPILARAINALPTRQRHAFTQSEILGSDIENMTLYGAHNADRVTAWRAKRSLQASLEANPEISQFY